MILTAALILPMAALAEPPSVLADKDFQGVGYSIEHSGNVEVYAAARDVGGKVAICGLVIVTNANSSARMLENKFTERLQFKVGGKFVQINTAVFARYYAVADAKVANGKAFCAVTLRPWNPVYATTKLEIIHNNTTIWF